MEERKQKYRLKTWIENHRMKWIFILFGIGIFLGVLQGILLGANFMQVGGMGIFVPLLYGPLLVIIEVCAGGSGTT